MKTIRHNTFETNSSSCHSITFSSKGSGILPSGDFILQVKGGDYGWEVETYSNAQDKFSYWFSAFIDCANIRFYDVTHFVYSDDIPYDYTYSTEIGVAGPNPMFTTSLAVTSAYLEEPVAYSDSVGVDMGQFGLEGVRYEDLTVSDHCAILHFTCPVSYDIAGNLTVSVTDFEHNTYIVSDSNMSVDDIDGITEVTVFSDALTFTDMKTISVNGMEIKMSELGVVPEHEIHASPAVTVVTTVTAEPDEPIIE